MYRDDDIRYVQIGIIWGVLYMWGPYSKAAPLVEGSQNAQNGQFGELTILGNKIKCPVSLTRNPKPETRNPKP